MKMWLDVAVTKKLGVLKQPYLFWQSDHKINPSAAHLLWAAILLEDPDAVQMVKGIITTEMSEGVAAGAGKGSSKDIANAVDTYVASLVEEFLGFGPDESFRKELVRRVDTAFLVA